MAKAATKKTTKKRTAKKRTAKKSQIKTQMQPEAFGTGTDAFAMQVSRSGVAAALVSIPNRYMHSPVETIALKDVKMNGNNTIHVTKNFTNLHILGK